MNMKALLEFLFHLLYIFCEDLRLLCTQEREYDEGGKKWGVW